MLYLLRNPARRNGGVVLQSLADGRGRGGMHTGADEGAAHSWAGERFLFPVVDDEVELFAEVIVAGPLVQLFPLVGTHEPV